MRKSLLSMLALFLFVQVSWAQLSGVKSIPGDYPNIEAAIASLNALGVGAGGVTFNVAAGHTETISNPAAGTINTLTSSAANPIVFQKSGAGLNPKITAALNGTGTLDGIIKIAGTDYVTFDGIDLEENAANLTSTTQMEWGFAILKASETDGSQFITIKNSTIDLSATNTATYGIYSNNHTVASSTQLVVTSVAGTNSNNKFFNNTITNTYNGIYLYGRADALPYAFYDQNNQVGFDGANNLLNLGGGTGTSYGIYILYQNNLTVANNFFGGVNNNTSGAFYAFYMSTNVNANLDIFNNTITVTHNSTSTFYGMYSLGGASGTSNTTNIYGNAVTGCTAPNITSGTWYGIYMYGGMTSNFYNNVVSNNTIGSATATSTGSIYGIYHYCSPTNAGTMNMYNNTLTNITRVQSTPGTGFGYYFYISGGNGTANIYNNLVDNLTVAASSTQYVVYNLYSGTKNMYDNTFTNVLNAMGTVYGLYNGNGVEGRFFNNKIANINSNAAASVVYGIYQSSGTSTYYYNNFISELKTPVSTSASAVNGIYIAGGTNVGCYFNTVYLNAASTGGTFGTNGVYAATASNVDLRNNAIINVSVPGATGTTVAYRRSSTTLTTYNNLSNNNDFYAGAPGVSRLIYTDGTNSDQTLADFKGRVSPRDASSVSELPPFFNVSASPYNLHIQSTTASQLESGGTVVSTPFAITTDLDGNSRFPNAGYPDNGASPASAPDIGADEFAGLMLDLTPPNIAFSPLGNTSGTGLRTLTTTITDATGVPTSGLGLPRLYWKINAGAYTGVTATYVSGNTYTFTFGGGVALNDVISYYIVAQDMANPRNLGANPSAGASGYTANPPAVTVPPTSPYTYTIVGTLAGVYPVGTGQVYPTITAAIADLNLKEVVAPVVFELWDATYASETLPMIIFKPAGVSPANTVTFRPKAGVSSLVTGFHANGVLVLYGAEHIIIDGSNSGGTDRSLIWENTNTAASCYGIGIFHDGNQGAQNNTIKNNVVRLGGKTATNWAIILNALGGGFHNTTIQNNELLNAYVGIQFAGVSGSTTNNGLVTQNIFGSDDDLQSLGNIGISISYSDGLVVSDNIFKNYKTGTNPKGVNIITGTTNSSIIGNHISQMIYIGTGGYGGKGIDINTGSLTSNLLVANNIITDLRGDGWSTLTSDAIVGIRVLGTTGGIKFYHNTVNLYGNMDRSSATTSAALYLPSASGFDLRNNILSNSIINNTTGTSKAYAIYNAGTNTNFTTINYNDYFASGVQGVLGYQSADVTTLAAWQAATGQDGNSLNVDPVFFDPMSNLTPTNNALNNTGIYLNDVIIDYNGTMRTSPPDIGAIEFGTNPTVTTLAAQTVCQNATLNGQINANGLFVNTFFDYGTTTAYGSTIAGTPVQVTGNTATAVTAAPAGLAPSTTYHYRLRGVTTTGVTSFGMDMTFTTEGLSAPAATTLPASPIGNTTVTLNGTVNASCDATTVTFEWGETMAYGNVTPASQSPVSGGTNVAVSADLINLLINTTYNYRVVATNGHGTTYGGNVSFQTGASPPTVVTNAASNIGNFAARINSTVNANNQSTTTSFEWGTTPAYGNVVAGVPLTVTGNTNEAVYADLSGLNYNTMYYYRAVGANTAGTTYGGQLTFMTLCPVPEAAGVITGPVSVCQGTGGHVYTVPAILYATGYSWTVPAGGTIVAGNNTNSITVNYNETAVSGNVTVMGTSVCGSGTSSSLAVTVNPIPVPVITGDDLACVNAVDSYQTETGMSGYAWTVSAGGQIMSGQGTSQVSIKWNVMGSQNLSVTYTNASGCPANSPTVMFVEVSALPVPSIAGNDVACQMSDENHVFTTEEGASNYVWTVTSGGTIVSGQGTYQIEVYWTGSGDQTVTVNYQNASGCQATTPSSFSVEILPLPAAAGAITGTANVCLPATEVAYSVAPIANAITYHWTVPFGATIVDGIGTNSITVNFGPDATAGDFSVYATNGCGEGVSSPDYGITVAPKPPKPTVSLEEYDLTSSATEGNQWYFEGEMIEDATDPTYTATETGNYWTVVTVDGCSSDPSEPVYVLVTGLGENALGKFEIHPVPNDGRFTVTINSQKEESWDVTVYNNLGVDVYQIKDFRVNGSHSETIQLNNPSRGTYTVVFRSRNEVIIRKVLVTN